VKPVTHPALDEIALTGIFYALGDPVRLRIVQNLYAAKRPLTCIEAAAGIDGLPISSRSHCFGILRETGLIRSERKGRECYNTLRLEELEKKFPNLLPTTMKL
jgi:DNA-binding transcriptional ArsR family regulator